MDNRQCSINGQLQSVVKVHDRGLHYGDGVFETIAIRNGALQHWPLHMQRLQQGCGRLLLPCPASDRLEQDVAQLCNHQPQPITNAVIKIIITRGSGGRGYQVPEQPQPTRIILIYPWPEGVTAGQQAGIGVTFCHTRLPYDPAFAGVKHLNRLTQVMASQELLGSPYQEGLLLDYSGHVVEGIRSNLFLVRQGCLLTPEIRSAGIAGIMRQQVIDCARSLSIPVDVAEYPSSVILAADELFLTNSIIQIWPVKQLMQHHYVPGPLTRRLQQALAVNGEK